MKTFLIIGMGSFGHHLCNSFLKQGVEVMVVDKEQKNLEDVLSDVTSAKIGDCTQPEVLRALDLEAFDACFVCMGTNFQNSLQITSLLKEMGAKQVYSKADEDIQAKFLLRNGADRIIYPEKDIAQRIAMYASSDNIFDCIGLSEEYFIMEIQPMAGWIGKTLKELNVRGNYKLNIMATKVGDSLYPMTCAEHVFTNEEHLVVMGHIDDIRRVTK